MQLPTAPEISDGEIIFNELEAKLIFKFFWPEEGARIDQSSISVSARRLAQQLLIIAIDASYAIGFVEGLMNTYAKPHKGVLDAAKKLAQNYMKHWWRHANKRDLTNIKIAKSVQVQTANVWRQEFLLVLMGS